jgi:hypothetical protein
MELFDTLGFQWDRGSVPRELPRASLERVIFRFHRMLPEYVWDAGVLEGNPFTFPEVKTLLEGVTVGGRKVSDQEQILNLAGSSKYLLDLIKHRQFGVSKSTFCSLHELVARNEALEWGHFRGEGPETQYTPDVALGARGRYTPLATEPGAGRLNEVFASGIRSLERNVSNSFERAAAFFLFGSLQQFFFDGNKRTSRFMMNGILMSDGIDAISIPAVRAAEFNSRMVDFYTSRDATNMMAFVLDCHPEIVQIRQLNQGLAAIKDLPGIEYFGPGDMVAQSFSAEAADSTSGLVHEQKPRPLSLEQTRRQASEEWRRTYYDKRAGQVKPTSDTNQARGRTDEEPSHEPDVGLDFDSEL